MDKSNFLLEKLVHQSDEEHKPSSQTTWLQISSLSLTSLLRRLLRRLVSVDLRELLDLSYLTCLT